MSTFYRNNQPAYDNYKDDLRSLISSFSGQGNTLTLPRPLISYFGNLEAALLFNQMIYWSDRSTLPDRWFYKTYEQWEEELGLSEYQVRKAVKKMTEAKPPLLATEIRKAQGNPTVHYQVMWDNFSESIVKFLQYRNRSNSSIEGKETSGTLHKHRLPTETTSEITGDAPEEVFDTAVSQTSSAPKGAKAKVLQKPGQKTFSEDDRARMVTKYSGRLDDVAFHIAQALNHTASLKAKNLALYVDGWLRREADKPWRQTPGRSNGGAPARGGPLPPEDLDDVKWRECIADINERKRRTAESILAREQAERAKPVP